jgi:hypothetical protein
MNIFRGKICGNCIIKTSDTINMKYILTRESLSEKEELIGKLLHVYSSIPVSKHKAKEVISRILMAEDINFTLNNTLIDFNSDIKDHDKIRFYDYFDSLIKNVETRGHNFEGLIAGLFNGELTDTANQQGYDMIIEDKKTSIKFLRNDNEKIILGRFKDIIQKNPELDSIVIEFDGLVNLFKTEGYSEQKRKILDSIFENMDQWIVGYPDDQNNPTKIILYIIQKNDIINYIINDTKIIITNKTGLKDLYGMSMNKRFMEEDKTKKIEIIFPNLNISDLYKIWKSEEEEYFSKFVFGSYGGKIRPDVIRHIIDNKEDISKKLLNYKNFIK